MAKDRFGYGTSPDVSLEQPSAQSQEQNNEVMMAHSYLIENFMPQVKENPELVKIFVGGSVDDKKAILKEYANDTDDALWMSDQWRLIESTSNRA